MRDSKTCRIILALMSFVVCTQLFADDRIVHMVNKDIGTYYVDADVDGNTVSMLVDTGSAYSVLSSDVVNHLHLKVKEHIVVLLADDRRVRANLYVLPTMIISNCKIHDIEFIVMPNQINILGLTALKKMSPLTIKLDESDMIFDCH